MREKSEEKGIEVLRYMLVACSHRSPSLCPKNNLIVFHFGEICKSNFFEKAEVVLTAGRMMRCENILCPRCAGVLRLHCVYQRHCRDGDGVKHYGWVAQGHCSVCNHYPAILPDFIMPHKHYKTEVIETVISESESGRVIEHFSGCAADVTTMRRWVRQFKVRGAVAVGWVLAVLLELYNRHISTLKLQNKKLLELLSSLAHEFPGVGTTTFGRVNIILTTRNRGFL